MFSCFILQYLCAKYVCFSVQSHDVLKILLKFKKSEKKKVATSSEVPIGRTLGFQDQEAVPFHQARVDSSLPSPASGPTPKDKERVLSGETGLQWILFLELLPYRYVSSSAWREFNYCFIYLLFSAFFFFLNVNFFPIYFY